ncbi:MAG: exo-alpha-sialidase [Rubrobacter sp.]|nr:exo-alpha-sialidase [Rubrobacter sp.]
MRRNVAFLALIALVATIVATGSVAAQTPGGSTEVTVGSEDSFFSQNKQNEPGLAVDASSPNIMAAGANDNIDLELCNAGDPTTCPFTPGVGVTGVQLSTNSGTSWVQPTYTGYSARGCVGDPNPDVTTDECVPAEDGPIGTLPNYFEHGLVSNGDPEVAFGPRMNAQGEFDYAAGSRLYFANIATNFPGTDQGFKGSGAIGVSRLDVTGPGNRLADALAGVNDAWYDPVIVTKQNSALFSDKEHLWADNAESSEFFGNAYVCNVGFRGAAGSEPVLFSRSTDGGDTWKVRQLSAATNNNQTGGRQGCFIKTDSEGTVYVFYLGTRIQDRQSVIFLTRSYDGGENFDKPRAIAEVEEVGIFDPVQGRSTFDGIAGGRTNSFPSVDIANGAPEGNGPDTIVLTFPDGPTPDEPGEPNEEARILTSVDGGDFFTDQEVGSPAGDRPDFPAVAISPDGTDAYLTYNNFLQPWQESTLSPARLMQGVVRHAEVNPATGAIAGWTDLFRGPTGDARGSSANGLGFEFLGDYNYAVATNDFGSAVWIDLREVADCPAMDAYRNFLAGGAEAPRPRPNTDCVQTEDSAFGNTDIFGGTYLDPS